MTDLITWLTMTIDTVDFSSQHDPELSAMLYPDHPGIGSTVVDLEQELHQIGQYFDESGAGKIPLPAIARISQLFEFYRSLDEQQITTLDCLTTTVKQIRGII